MARNVIRLLAAMIAFAALSGCANDHANDRDLRKQAAEQGRAAAAEEIRNGHFVLYGGPSFGGGPSPDAQTGLPVIWSGDHAPYQYERDFNKAHNQYVREHIKLIKTPASQPFISNATEPTRIPPR